LGSNNQRSKERAMRLLFISNGLTDSEAIQQRLIQTGHHVTLLAEEHLTHPVLQTAMFDHILLNIQCPLLHGHTLFA